LILSERERAGEGIKYYNNRCSKEVQWGKKWPRILVKEIRVG